MPGSLTRNLRYAARTLRKTPVFTASVVLTFALGIGADTAVFSAVDAILLRPLPFPAPDRLVSLAQFNPQDPQQPFVAPARLEDWNRLSSAFQAITGYYAQDDSELSGELPEKLRRAFVTSGFLQVWGIAPELGRGFTPAEERFHGPGAVLISDRLWRRRFSADPRVLGRTLRFSGYSLPVVGVMPPSFLFPDRDVDLWSPSPADGPGRQIRDVGWYIATGRMKPGVALAQARADLAAVQANLGRQFTRTDAAVAVSITPLQEAATAGVRGSLWVLFASVSLLLLIACANIAALLLARAAGREPEIAVRFSLGASRPDIAAQLLSEVVLLALAGAGLGLLAAGGAARVFRALAAGLPGIDRIGLDWRVAAYSLACALAATLLCGILPALRSTRLASLAQAGRAAVSHRHPFRFVLVGAQVALAVTLLSGAGLLVRSFQALSRVSPGFDPEHVLMFHLSTTWAETSDRNASNQRMQRVLDALRNTPGIESAATSAFLPGVPFQYQLEVQTAEGRAETESRMLAQARFVTPGYFAALRIPLLAGDMCRDDPSVAAAMVNRAFANAYLPGAAAIGLHLVQPSNPYIPPAAVRGIVGDARETGLDHPAPPTVYWCSGSTLPGAFFLLRTRGDPRRMAQTVRLRVHEVEPRRSVYGLTPLTGRISDAYAQNRLRTLLLSFFALSAIALASIGLYGTLSYLVNLRRREIGLRLALGARPAAIARQFLAQALLVCACGGAAGVALATSSSRLLAGMLYGVSPGDPLTLACVLAAMAAVSVAASCLPALRAARLDPMRVLRDE